MQMIAVCLSVRNHFTGKRRVRRVFMELGALYVDVAETALNSSVYFEFWI